MKYIKHWREYRKLPNEERKNYDKRIMIMHFKIIQVPFYLLLLVILECLGIKKNICVYFLWGVRSE